SVAAAPSVISRSNTARVWDALRTVTDPEIPMISIVDMGMVSKVFLDGESVFVELSPTFAGCPALDLIRANVENSLRDTGILDAHVRFVFDPPWSSDRITPEGRRKLKEFGVAPPGEACRKEAVLDIVACPMCGSQDTSLESIFGPTLCRAIRYCNAC